MLRSLYRPQQRSEIRRATSDGGNSNYPPSHKTRVLTLVIPSAEDSQRHSHKHTNHILSNNSDRRKLANNVQLRGSLIMLIELLARFASTCSGGAHASDSFFQLAVSVSDGSLSLPDTCVLQSSARAGNIYRKSKSHVDKRNILNPRPRSARCGRAAAMAQELMLTAGLSAPTITELQIENVLHRISAVRPALLPQRCRDRSSPSPLFGVGLHCL